MRHRSTCCSIGACLIWMLTGCAGAGTPPPQPSRAGTGSASAPLQLSVTMGQQFELAMGQTASVAGVSSTVTFRAVPSDSRCPAGTQCVQAGNAEVVLGVATGGGAPADVVLNTTSGPREQTLRNGILRLVSLSPTPVAGTATDPSTYVATLCVCRP